MKESAPAFLFYVNDWLNDDAVIMMSAAERGIYIDLLAYAWRDGSLPGNPAVLARMVREPLPDFLKLWESVGGRFIAREDGRLVNPRLEKERAKEAERQEKRAERARKGAQASNKLQSAAREREGGVAQAEHERGISGPQAEHEQSTPPLDPAKRSEANGNEENIDSCDEQARTPEPVKSRKKKDGQRKEKLGIKLEPPSMPDGLPSTLPDDMTALKRVAVVFLNAFGNCRSPEALGKHGPLYVDALAIFRNRGATVRETWAAFCDALAARSGRPMFGATAKNAVIYLRPKAHQTGMNFSDRKPIGSVKPQ